MNGASSPALARAAFADQDNLPDWDGLEAAIYGIFERRYFANNGPLVQELDAALAAHCRVDHAVCVANEGVAFAILAAAIAAPGDVLVPALSSLPLRGALRWGGLIPVPYDDATKSFDRAANACTIRRTPRTVAICGVHTWGRVGDVDGVTRLAEDAGVPLIFDGTGAFGCERNGIAIAAFGRATVFSLHSATVINGGNAAFVATSDCELAKILRTMRNFHHAETFAPVPLRINGKVSEIQAAMALRSLEQFPRNVARNHERYTAYCAGLAGLRGVTLLPFDPNDRPNYAEIVVRIDEREAGIGPAQLARLLSAENIMCSGPFNGPVGESIASAPELCSSGPSRGDTFLRSVMRLPNSQWLTVAEVATICEMFVRILGKR